MSTSSAEFYGLSVSQWFLTNFSLYFWLYRTPIIFLSDYIFRQLDWFETAEWQAYEHTGLFSTTVDLVPFLCLIIRFYSLSHLNVSNSIFLSMTRYYIFLFFPFLPPFFPSYLPSSTLPLFFLPPSFPFFLPYFLRFDLVVYLIFRLFPILLMFFVVEQDAFLKSPACTNHTSFFTCSAMWINLMLEVHFITLHYFIIHLELSKA